MAKKQEKAACRKTEDDEKTKKGKKDSKKNKAFFSKKEKEPLTGIDLEDTYLFSQDWIDFDHIVWGMIKTKDGRYVKILEIEPITFLLRTPEERADIIEDFYMWLKIAPIRMQFVMTTTYTDSTRLIQQLMKQTKNCKDNRIIERRNELIEHVKRMSTAEALSKKFYLVYQYEGEDDGSKATSEMEIWQTMEGVKNLAASYFYKMGNQIVDHSVDGENMFLANVLYKAYNPKSSVTETVEHRIDRINADYARVCLSQNKEFVRDKIPETSYIAPRGVDFNNAKYVVMDGIYMAFLYVKPKGYRNEVVSGWFEKFTSFGEGVTVNMFSVKKSRFTTIDRVGRAMRHRRVEAREKNRTSEEASNLAHAAANAEYIRDRMSSCNEDLYDVFIMLTITADTEKALMKRKNHIKTILYSKDCFMEDCLLHNEEALKMSMPLLSIQPALFERGRRNFLTSSLASSYMFTAYEVFEERGVVLGLNGSNSSLVVPDPFNTSKYANGNVIILGTSGKGKTFLLMTLAYALRLSGRPVYCILPEKGHEWRAMTQAIGGTYIELAPGTKDCVNIMAIRPQKAINKSLIEMEEEENSSLLTKKIHQITTFIQLNLSRDIMTNTEEATISTVLTELYAEFGITADNDSIWEDKQKGILKKMPIIEDFYNKAVKNEVLKKNVAYILDPYVHGEGKNMNAQTNVDLNNDFVCISVSKASKQQIAPFSFVAIDCCYDAIKADRSENCGLVMDEIWKMMINEYASEYVMEIYKIIRGYGGIAISATQELSDLKRSENGAGIINNAKLKFILGMEKGQANSLREILDISDNDVKTLIKQDRGQALFFANGDKVPIFVKSPEEWIRYFTTDASLLRKYASEEEKEGKAKKTAEQIDEEE